MMDGMYPTIEQFTTSFQEANKKPKNLQDPVPKWSIPIIFIRAANDFVP